MAEMLPLIQIAPETNLTLDPSSGIIGAALGRDVVLVTMDTINAQLDELEIGVNDLYTSLDPSSIPANSFPGREGVYLEAGRLTNIVYGFIVGLVLMFALFGKF
ncbi:MAG: tetrahydromethanopterin S-methyltransferase subunit MtrB [Methanobacterium sp.]